MRVIYYLIVILIGSLTQLANAQSAVQIIPSAGPSNSTLLSDYYTGRQNGLTVLLRNLDAIQPFLQGYFRLSIEGQGVKLQTGSYAIFPSIDLMEGNMVNIGPSDLTVYFKPQYLQGSIGFGVNQPNIFPEGYYQFCFELLEKNTNRLIGSKQCVDAHLSHSESPDLTLPEKGKKIVLLDSLPLVFQWKAQHQNAQSTEYAYYLVELDTNDKVTETSFVKAKPVYSVMLKEEKLVYDKEKPFLTKGKKYAWRVQANAINDNQENVPLKNDGFSEIYWFIL